MDQWLVRTASNIIAGPYSKEQVVKLIQEGKLGLQDEVCQANQYWIFLHEHLEVLRQLGINMPRSARGDDEEVTETQTDNGAGSNPTIEMELESLPETPEDYEGGTALISRGTFNDARSTDSGPSRAAVGAVQSAQSLGQATTTQGASPAQSAQPMSVSPVARTAQPAAASAIRSSTPAPSGSLGQRPMGALSGGQAHVVGAQALSAAPDVPIERSSIWKVLAWALILVVCTIVYAVLRLLHMANRI